MKKPVVMVVEDDIEYSKEIAEDVKNFDKYEVVIANSASAAFEQLEKYRTDDKVDENQVRLILLDINMPGMDGLQFLEKLRRSYDYEQIGVVMVTAYEDEQKWDKASSSFIVGYIKKPYDRKELLGVIDKFFSNKAAKFDMVVETLGKRFEKGKELR